MLKILLGDIKQGGKKNILKLVVTFLFVLVIGIMFNKMVRDMNVHGTSTILPSFGDYILNVLGGMARFVKKDNNSFDVPYIWMCVHLLVASMVFTYPTNDLHNRGTSVIMQYGSRTKWWLSKCIWSVLQVLTVYTVMVLTIMVLTGVNKTFGVYEIHGNMFHEVTIIATDSKIILSAIAYSILYSITCALIQITISLWSNSAIGLMVVVCSHVLSAYTMSDVLIGNISMLYRLEGIVSDSINPIKGICLCVFLIVIAIMLGVKRIRSMDILNK